MDNIEQDEIIPSPEYIKAFNEGYVMAQFSPSFSNDSISNMPASDRNKGFSKGMMQYEVEKKLERNMSFLSKVRQEPKKDTTKEKGNKDMDRE